MDIFIQRLLDGTANGAIYSMMALGIVLVFISTGTLNIALGSMGMFCAMTAWWLWSPDHAGLPLWVGFVAAVLVGFFGGAFLERVFVRPVEKDKNHLRVVIVTLALLLALEAGAGYLFTVDTVRLPSFLPRGYVQVGSARLDYDSLTLVCVAAAIAVTMYFMFERTRIGLGMRASVDNPDSARLSGVRRNHMLMLGWALAGALAAIAGLLIAPTTLVSTTMLNNALFLGFAAAALGGFTSPFGAMAGGLIMGIIETLGPAYIPFIDNQLSLLPVFAVMIAILLIRPTGLFGRTETARL
ncbi:branched-chain amino acid ABC transporter permease [Rhodococcus qingshengii]|uniref:branched-chain amino acid ABC transporter permease n=1 Tax=Rhodococcus qingshengii TaxID=334542 RepID=UPI0010A63C2D|nr:branched-chain amino acid ABC transporter permease [Rhodococcus qingshengii]THJ67602.1 branched-chain amino acid ABC transporter permease [Rhodococcus qingshengii]